jgi:hypothetical protein
MEDAEVEPEHSEHEQQEPCIKPPILAEGKEKYIFHDWIPVNALNVAPTATSNKQIISTQTIDKGYYGKTQSRGFKLSVGRSLLGVAKLRTCDPTGLPPGVGTWRKP